MDRGRKVWCRRGEANQRPTDSETLAHPLNYAGMTQIFMLRIRLRTCQGGVLGRQTLPIFEALTDNPINLKHTGWTECGEVRLLRSHRNSWQKSYVTLERE